jgi:hypothetical protein
MPITDAAKNIALDALAGAITHLSVHSAFSITGANELTGGSPAYARQPLAWSAAAAGNLSLAGPETFDIPAAGQVAFIGGWTALTAGTFRGMWPANGGTPMPFTAVGTTDLITADAHGFVNTDTVVVWDLGAGSVVPTGLTEGTVYFVRDVAGDTFKLALTSGGTAIDLTSDGAGLIQRITVEVFAGQGTYLVNDLDIPLAGA